MTSSLGRRQGWQLALISLAAVGLYVGFRKLPTGTNLNHMDFRVSGRNSIEFCDPANPQFIPVVAVRSPVAMSLRTATPSEAGRRVEAIVRLETATGKPLAPEDLVLAHTRKLHLLIVDPTLQDYQHVHPDPAKTPGEWNFSFTPRGGGVYRVFADFTPAATRRGLYAHADMAVRGPALPLNEHGFLTESRNGYQFSLTSVQSSGDAIGVASSATSRSTIIRAGQTADLRFVVARSDGGPVSLEPVMDAYAHLVAFDETRGGFAHLHPTETDLSHRPDSLRPTLSFKVTVPMPGRYVIWAQVALEGHEVFVPFWVDVAG